MNGPQAFWGPHPERPSQPTPPVAPISPSPSPCGLAASLTPSVPAPLPSGQPLAQRAPGRVRSARISPEGARAVSSWGGESKLDQTRALPQGQIGGRLRPERGRRTKPLSGEGRGEGGGSVGRDQATWEFWVEHLRVGLGDLGA